MAKALSKSELVLLVENFNNESQNLYASFHNSGISIDTVCINTDGFLPEDVISPYEFFLGDFKNSEQNPGHPRYFNQIDIPDFWEIKATNNSGEIFDFNQKKGKIFYTSDTGKRLVKVIDWYDSKGNVRISTHYNKYGAVYAKTIFNAAGQRVSRSYFSEKNQEIIVENFVTGDIILNYKDRTFFFHSKTDFVCFFFRESELNQKKILYNSLALPFFISNYMNRNDIKDLLIWQEAPRNDLPGNMKQIFDGASNSDYVLVQNKKSLENLIACGADRSKISYLGNVFEFARENRHLSRALICTNSDHIERLKEVVEGLSEVEINICAITEMSPKLMAFSKYKNVKLFPACKKYLQDELFINCDIYLDINHENEILDAVERAFLNNMLIFAFDEVRHNAKFVDQQNVFKAEDYKVMIKSIQDITFSEELLNKKLLEQRTAAGAVDANEFQKTILGLV